MSESVLEGPIKTKDAIFKALKKSSAPASASSFPRNSPTCFVQNPGHGELRLVFFNMVDATAAGLCGSGVRKEHIAAQVHPDGEVEERLQEAELDALKDRYVGVGNFKLYQYLPLKLKGKVRKEFMPSTARADHMLAEHQLVGEFNLRPLPKKDTYASLSGTDEMPRAVEVIAAMVNVCTRLRRPPEGLGAEAPFSGVKLPSNYIAPSAR